MCIRDSYRMDRAALGKDPYTNYTFQEILDEGGICMDQAYFAAVSYTHLKGR